MFCGIFRGFGLDFFECSWAIELGWAMLRVEVSKALLLIPSTRTRRSFCASWSPMPQMPWTRSVMSPSLILTRLRRSVSFKWKDCFRARYFTWFRHDPTSITPLCSTRSTVVCPWFAACQKNGLFRKPGRQSLMPRWRNGWVGLWRWERCAECFDFTSHGGNPKVLPCQG